MESQPTHATAAVSESAGNGCVGVVVDSRAATDWSIVEETIFAALRHMGIPYRVFDLADAHLAAAALDDLRAVLLAQAHLGRRLGAAGAEALGTAVHGGLGLICFDSDLPAYDQPLAQILGLSGQSLTLSRGKVRLANDRHFITGTRAAGEALFFTVPVEFTRVDAPALADPAVCLLVSDDGWPALVARQVGAGRVVTWTLHPRVWTNRHFGHAMGLDDLFWKGIVWAARKPFVMHAMPPFVTYLEDDGSSSYNHFRYLDIFNQHGYLPHVELHVDDIDKVLHDVHGQDSQTMRAKSAAGLATFGAHAFTYNHHIYFDHAGRQPYPDAVLAENFRQVDEKFRSWGLPLGRFANPHFGEVGLNALPHLTGRGVEFIGALLPFGVAWFEQRLELKEVKLAPYGRSGFVFESLPEHPEFFGVNALIMPRQMTGVPMVASEFLWNNTIFWDESAENNLAGAAQQALAQMRLGLDSLYFGELYTHEQRIAVLSMRELDEILTLIDQGLKKHTYLHRPYDYIAEYARSKVRSWLTRVSVNAGGQVTCDLSGHTSLTTSVYLFTEADGETRRNFLDVPPFSGSVRIEN